MSMLLLDTTGYFPEHRRPTHPSSLSYQSLTLTSAEEVLRSLSYQHHLVAYTKNFYHQNGFESFSSSSTSSPVQVPGAHHPAQRHVYLSPGTFARPCRSLPESRRTSFTSVSYPSIQQQLGGSYGLISNGRRQEPYRGRSTSKSSPPPTPQKGPNKLNTESKGCWTKRRSNQPC